MTIIKRCEKEVQGSWADKQLQAATWLDHFVPHYTGRCVSALNHQCPAKHTASRWMPVRNGSTISMPRTE